MPLKSAHAVHRIERGLELRDVGWSIVALLSQFLGSTPPITAGSIPLGDLDLEGTGPLQVRNVQLGLALRRKTVYVVHVDNIGMQSGGEEPATAKCTSSEVYRLGVACAARNRDVPL